MSFLIDTNVLSEMRKRYPDPVVVAWFKARPSNGLYLSALTLGEIRKGIELVPDLARKKMLDDWLVTALPAYFAGRILPVDARVCDRWGRLLAAAGRSVPAIDSLLAATAAEYGLAVVTRNVKDFAGMPVATVNPWQA